MDGPSLSQSGLPSCSIIRRRPVRSPKPRRIGRPRAVSIERPTGPRSCYLPILGVRAPGQVLLYDTDGHLRFNGGITASRGHEGNKKGRQALTDLILTGTTDRPSSFVFGCVLMEKAVHIDSG